MMFIPYILFWSFVIKFILFWCAIYTAHGIHDGYVIRGGRNPWSEEWHLFDVIMFVPIQAVICFSLAWGSWWRFTLLFALASMIRGMCHNAASRKVQGVSVNSLGSIDFWWDIDGIYIYLHDKFYINQYVFQIMIISGLVYLLHIYASK